jgi:hypothetical protein
LVSRRHDHDDKMADEILSVKSTKEIFFTKAYGYPASHFKRNESPLPVGEGLEVRSMAGQFLKAAAVSTEKAVEMMKLTKRQIEVTMFPVGVEKLEVLQVGKLMEN